MKIVHVKCKVCTTLPTLAHSKYSTMIAIAIIIIIEDFKVEERPKILVFESLLCDIVQNKILEGDRLKSACQKINGIVQMQNDQDKN